MAASGRVQRTLAAFEPLKRLWAQVPSRCVPSQALQSLSLTSRLSLITQNLDAFSTRPVSRAKQLLGEIIEVSRRPDVVFFQEVTSDVRNSILSNVDIRKAFVVTDAEDETSFEGVPFANMTLLSRERFAFDWEPQSGEKFVVGPVFRVTLPSKYGRCALSVDVMPPPSTPSSPMRACRLINVHLDSLGHTFSYRAAQIEILAGLLREPGCGGGLIAGDFNAISPHDHALLDKNDLVDAWIALHGKEGPDGATWGVGMMRHDGLKPGRLDKVAMLGVEANDMEILRPGLVEVPKPGGDSDYIPCSDHDGLRLSFTV